LDTGLRAIGGPGRRWWLDPAALRQRLDPAEVFLLRRRLLLLSLRRLTVHLVLIDQSQVHQGF
ncbi:MAG: hypothetical protein WAN34_06860, partial [Acidimicrobiia bacterium]